MNNNFSESDGDDLVSSTELPDSFSSGITVDVFATSDLGHVRGNNEDHYLVARVGRALETTFSNLNDNPPSLKFAETGHAMIVADGVGGQAGGEIASSHAILALLNLALRTPDWQFRWGMKELNTVMWRAQDRFRRVDAALHQEASEHAGLSGMCTTMTAALSHGKDLIVGHVGDSRAYLLHEGKLKQLTRDHTLANKLLEEDAADSDDLLLVGLSNALLQAVGGSESEIKPDVDHYELADGDQLLVCTDGLTDMVNDEAIQAVLIESNSAMSACRNLINLALSNGGVDNVTVIVARYSMP